MFSERIKSGCYLSYLAFCVSDPGFFVSLVELQRSKLGDVAHVASDFKSN